MAARGSIVLPGGTAEGAGPGGTTVYPGGGVAPANMVGAFPGASTVYYDPIKAAKARKLNPIQYGQKYGEFIRGEIQKNYSMAQGIALDELNAELQGMEHFVPAASALQRTQVAKDNPFNQEQRTQQLDVALPGMRGALAQQTANAQQYSTGRMLNESDDRALELNLRSAAADRATAGGFGASSSVAKKASDLLSASERLKISQYGEQLLGANAQLRSSIELAPTEYANAGSQVRVMPEVGAGRLTAQNLSELNQYATIPATTAMSTVIQQRQFNTQLRQRTREFNATNELQAAEFNATASNQFALTKFGYQVAQAGATAGAVQTGLNNQIGVQQQAAYQDAFGAALANGQSSAQTGALANAGASLLPAAISGLSNALKGSGQDSGDTTGSNPNGYDGGISYPAYTESESPSQVPDIISSGTVPDYNTGYNPASETPAAGDFTAGNIPDFSTDFNSGGGDFAGSMRSLTGGDLGTANVPAYGSDMVTQTAGLGLQPTPLTTPIGANFSGNMVQSNAQLLASSDYTMGAGVLGLTQQIAAPLAGFNAEEMAKWDEYSSLTNDTGFVAELDTLKGENNMKGFVDKLTATYHNTTTDNIETSKDPGGAILAASSASRIFENWNQISPAQKSMALAGFGMQAYRFSDGSSLASKTIPATKDSTYGGMTLGTAAGLFEKGYNAYGVAQGWDTLNDAYKALSGTKGTPEQIAEFAKKNNMLGYGPTNAAVPITVEELKSGGWKPAANYGIGAVLGSSVAAIPKGYSKVATDASGQVVAIPTPNIATAAGATQGQKQFKAYRELTWDQVQPAFSQNASGIGSSITQAVDSAAGTQIGGPAGAMVGGAAGAGVAAVTSFENGKPIQGTIQAGSAAAQGANAAGVQGAGAAVQGAGAVGSGYGAVVSGQNAINQWNDGNKTGAAVSGTQAAAYGGAAAQMGSQALGYGAMSGLPSAAALGGAGMAVGGAAMTYQNWGSGNATAGAIGGSMMMAGTIMMVGGPVGWIAGGALMAGAVIGTSVKTGKPESQNARDQIRETWQKNEFLVDKDFNVTLADGTKMNIGEDGKTGMHTVTDPSQLVSQQQDRAGEKKLYAYDCDYTNDLDYVANMGGNTLTRLLFGSKATNCDQIGSQLGNAMLGKVGYNQQMTKENFDYVMANTRAQFAKGGINSKADMYQLANQAYAEGKFNEADTAAAHQTADMMFEKNGYQIAQGLMQGRKSGAQVAADKAEAEGKKESPASKPSETGAAAGAAISQVGQGASPKAPAPIRPGTVPVGAVAKSPFDSAVPGAVNSRAPSPIDDSGFVPYSNPRNFTAMPTMSSITKEQAIRRNKAQFMEARA